MTTAHTSSPLSLQARIAATLVTPLSPLAIAIYDSWFLTVRRQRGEGGS